MMTSYRSVAKKLHAMCQKNPKSKATRDEVRKRRQKTTTVLVPKTFPACDFLN
jgi:hypothetical protein